MKGGWLCCLLLTFASVRADGLPAIHGGIDAATVEMTAKFGPHGDPLHYDASLVIDVGTRCSATMIGPRVLLSAAHCAVSYTHLTLPTKRIV